MELSHFSLIFAAAVIVQLSLFAFAAPASTPPSNYTDLSSLLAFKASIVADPLGILTTNWTTNTSFCSWAGILCSRRRQRVIALNLRSFSLQGTVSPHLANLSFLSYLDLAMNNLTGPIPESLGRLPRLAGLVLARNHLTGSIPSQIFNISSLTRLNLATNNLSGFLPTNHSSFSQFKNLQSLTLSNNQFIGTIPADLGDVSTLAVLALGGNLLTGTIPTSLSNLTNLNTLDLSFNNLEGEIPTELVTLPNLQWVQLGANGLTGPIPIPIPISNASSSSMISMFDVSVNNLTGTVPAMLGISMPLLKRLHLGTNQLTGSLDFITPLSNCKYLEILILSHNQFKGILPDSVGNLSTNLQYFLANDNQINGDIPSGLGNLSSLTFLNLKINELTGGIPSALARLRKLQEMFLDYNMISGSIPVELGLMTSLSTMYLTNNRLSGPIPDSIGNITGLQRLSLAVNTLTARIPHNFWNLKGLVELYLFQNTLQGELPPEIGNLKSLNNLFMSTNNLSGNIPDAIGELQMLAGLELSSNSFSGPIPQSLGSLVSIEYLNLSSNVLSGVIPKSLANLKYLGSLDLSYNELEGQIPNGSVFSNLTIPYLVGNTALCGAPQLGFPICPAISTASTSNGRKGRRRVLKYILPAIAAGLALFACAYLLVIIRSKRKAKASAHGDDTPDLINHRFISYHELVRATNNFCEANLLGKGSFGSVFKGCLDDGLVIAAKVLNLEVEGASQSFDAECGALSVVRHRNLVKVISTCSNLDFKALVLEFMPNGSLEQWLYSHNYCLNLVERIDVVIDVCSALEYLHHHHPHAVVHCDLKPSNVLLDENMTARVSDFGIARLLLGDSISLASASAPGTIGYMAPEYGSMGKVSTKGDVYSFGIMLLEIFTRKKPTDPMFGGDSSLRQWISNAHPAQVLEIADSNLLKNYSNSQQQDSKSVPAIRQCLTSIMELGLLCSRDSPKDRTEMKDVGPV